MLVGILILLLAILLISFILFIVYHFVSTSSGSGGGGDRIGINYKTGVSPEFDSIVADVQKIVNLMENTVCTEVKELLTEELYKTLQSVSTVSCDEIRQNMENELVEFRDPAVKALVTNILNNVCTGAHVDAAKVEKLVKGAFSSMCYQEW